MKNTTFVSAGAGSGKTYRLTQDIARMVEQGECRAEEIILTTFTDAAANELRQKVRSTLYSKGLYEAAMNIDNAAIGTIHSIAYQLVSRYWYLLGISANVSIMDTEGSKFCIAQSLSSLPTEANLTTFDSVCKSFNIILPKSTQLDFGFWKHELLNLIDKTVELCLTEEQLEEERIQSKELLNSVVNWNDFEITDDIVTDVINRLQPIFDALADHARGDAEYKKAKRVELEKSIADLKKYSGDIGQFPISKLMSIVSTYAAASQKYIQKAFAADILFFAELAEKIPCSSQVKNLIERYIDIIFSLAIKWKKKYEEFKRERCLLDYGDLLMKFDELLGKDEVVAELKSRYKVAFIDEFQDCSPLQVKSFERLSELMGRSVWVGDIKQAIYGFRGTNTELIMSVINTVAQKKDGNQPDSLKCCWRSNKTIVDLVNSVFCNSVFKELAALNEELVKLNMPERKPTDPKAPEERNLLHLHLDGRNKEQVAQALITQVKELIESHTYRPDEIAILCSDKYDVMDCVKALGKSGISYNAQIDSELLKSDNLEDEVSNFITAVVSFAARGDNELSKAIVVNFIERGFTTSKIVSDKLRFEEEPKEGRRKWLEGVDVVNRFEQLRTAIGNQSVSAAIETIVVELGLCDLINRVDPMAPAYNYCSALVATAKTYESLCSNFGLSSTLVGFVEHLKSHPVECPGDDNGVSVITYHKSKGLEWPCVILYSLNDSPVDPEKTFFGVLVHSSVSKTRLRLIPTVLKSVVKKDMLARFEEEEFFKGLRSAVLAEAKRLMYVGMTRPKEQLILATSGRVDNGDKWLTEIGCESIDSHSTASVIRWGGSDWLHKCCQYEESEPVDGIVEFDVLKQPEVRETFDAKLVSPSKVEANDAYAVEQCATFAERLSATTAGGQSDVIGNFVHHAMCLWNGDESVIERLAAVYGVSVDAADLASSIRAFRAWMEKTYGAPISIERELPFSFVNEQGQVVNGEIDLVYRTAEGDVLVDYKTYQGNTSFLIAPSNKAFYAGKYSGQIALYEEALKRDGRSVRDRLICYMSLGVVIRMNLK